MDTADRWGPFAEGIDAAERTARLRCLRAIVHLTCGPRGEELQGYLSRAERDETALPRAVAVLNAMASLDRRRVLASYAAITRPGR